MKAYLCQTTNGPQYIHLQADAKKLDPNFETVEVDISKGPLLDMLNDLMRQAHANSGSQPVVGVEEQQENPPPAPAVPPIPKPKSGQPPHAVRSDIQVDWETFIWDIPAAEAYRLNTLQKVLDERRREIESGINV